jgi:hypothetical protein
MGNDRRGRRRGALNGAAAAVLASIALLACAVPAWAGGTVIYGGAAIIVGPGFYYYGPRSVYTPYTSAAEAALYLDSADACLRMGRCTAFDVYRFQGRPNRLQRLAPQAPLDPSQAGFAGDMPRFDVEATPPENIAPAYRDASQVRPEYRDVGAPLSR